MLKALMLSAGLVALYFGAEWLVRGGASLAVRPGVTPLLVGLTVLAYGISTPELIVSSMAAAKGQGAIAIGNAVDSSIFNIGVILGLARALDIALVIALLVVWGSLPADSAYSPLAWVKLMRRGNSDFH